MQLIEEPKIVHQEKKGIVLVKRTIETVDEFGNDYILQLLPPDQKYIYLSTALRTLLNVNDGDYISFALDNENKLYYICKEIDHNNGYLVQNGKIESNVEWRNIFNTFNLETTKIEDGKLKFHISHYVREQEELPDYSLFLINHPWVAEKSKKNKKEVEFVATEKNNELYTWAEQNMASKETLKGVDFGFDSVYETQKYYKQSTANVKKYLEDSLGIKQSSKKEEEKPSTKRQAPKKGISEKDLLIQLLEEDKSEF